MSPLLSGPPTYTIVVSTSPPGLWVLVDGERYNTPREFSWELGSSHEIRAPEVVEVGEGERLMFTGWSDGLSSPSRELDVKERASYTAMCKRQYYLAVDAGPGRTVGGSG